MRVHPTEDLRPLPSSTPRSTDRRNPLVRVVKFGGSSLAGAAAFDAAVSRIERLRTDGVLPIVVTSALGGVTDRLLELGRRTGSDASPRELDALLATGDAAAAALFAGALESRGVPARSLHAAQLGMRTDDRHGHATIESIDPRPTLRLLSDGIVPVVAGFQGTTRLGDTTTLGRGGSDTTAVAMAIAASRSIGRAVLCEILTDVSGVHTIDPNRHRRAGCDAQRRRHAQPVRLSRLSHTQLLELCNGGSRIVAPEAARLALDASIDLRIGAADADATDADATIVDGRSAIDPRAFAIASAQDRCLLQRDPSDTPIEPAVWRRRHDALRRGLGPGAWTLDAHGERLLLPEPLADEAIEILSEAEHGAADLRWRRRGSGSTITIVSGAAVEFTELPPPEFRLPSGTTIWNVSKNRLLETADAWHARLLGHPGADPPSASRSPEIEVLTAPARQIDPSSAAAARTGT